MSFSIAYRFLLVTISFSLLMPVLATELQAQSLWQKRDSRKAFLFRDLNARSIGDILTIAINENTDVANSDSRAMNKQTSNSGTGAFSYSGGTTGSASTQFSSGSTRDFDGGVNFSSDRQFLDRFSVTVIDVLPNGNLLVSGERDVLVEGDTKRLSVSGVIRSQDIRNDNSVQSSNVARMQISYSGAGSETKFVNQGWLGRRINKFWPF